MLPLRVEGGNLWQWAGGQTQQLTQQLPLQLLPPFLLIIKQCSSVRGQENFRIMIMLILLYYNNNCYSYDND